MYVFLYMCLYIHIHQRKQGLVVTILFSSLSENLGTKKMN